MRSTDCTTGSCDTAGDSSPGCRPPAQARRNAQRVACASDRPPRPRLLHQQDKHVRQGPACDHRQDIARQCVKTVTGYPLEELRRYSDWTPFFSAWEMKGRFPDILNNPASGEAARKLYDDATAMLDQIIEARWLTANGVLGLFPSSSLGAHIDV